MTVLILILLLGAVALWPVQPSPRARAWRHPAEGASSASDNAAGRASAPPRRRLPWNRAGRVGSDAERADRRAQHAELVTVGLEAGLGPREAWALAVQAAGDRRLDGSTGFALTGGLPDDSESGRWLAGPAPDLLDRALQLSDLVGTPAAHATRVAADQLREAARALRRRETLLAGPRASMTLLALLPLVGPIFTLAMGLPLTQVYAVGWAPLSCGVGVGLTLAGWVVARVMIKRASRPGLLPPPMPP